MEPILDAEFAKHRVIVALDCKIAVTNRPVPWAYRTVGGITQAKILAAVWRRIERVCGRTPLPLIALPTGARLNFDSRANRLNPIAANLFLSEGSAITNFVRFS